MFVNELSHPLYGPQTLWSSVGGRIPQSSDGTLYVISWEKESPQEKKEAIHEMFRRTQTPTMSLTSLLVDR